MGVFIYSFAVGRFNRGLTVTVFDNCFVFNFLVPFSVSTFAACSTAKVGKTVKFFPIWYDIFAGNALPLVSGMYSLALTLSIILEPSAERSIRVWFSLLVFTEDYRDLRSTQVLHSSFPESLVWEVRLHSWFIMGSFEVTGFESECFSCRLFLDAEA